MFRTYQSRHTKRWPATYANFPGFHKEYPCAMPCATVFLTRKKIVARAKRKSDVLGVYKGARRGWLGSSDRLRVKGGVLKRATLRGCSRGTQRVSGTIAAAALAALCGHRHTESAAVALIKVLVSTVTFSATSCGITVISSELLLSGRVNSAVSVLLPSARRRRLGARATTRVPVQLG